MDLDTGKEATVVVGVVKEKGSIRTTPIALKDDVQSVAFSEAPFCDANIVGVFPSTLKKHGHLVSFQEAPVVVGAIKRKALAKFVESANAAEACKHLHKCSLPELGGGKLFVEQFFSAKFVLPNRIYAVVAV